jgi:(p)ppGpp synthase/HD superfamily hydrolase
VRSSTVEWARATAVRVHAGQKYQGKPYFTAHVEAVVALVQHAHHQHAPASVLAVAYLHDVLEDVTDGSVTLADVQANTSIRVANAVAVLTRPPGSRADTNAAYFRAIADNPLAVVVKTADRLANVLASPGTKFAALYRRERLMFDLLKPGDTEQGPHAVLWDLLEAAYLKITPSV